MVAENLTNIDLYRNANGKFVARDPDTGETYPVPFESVDVESLNIGDSYLTAKNDAELDTAYNTNNRGKRIFLGATTFSDIRTLSERRTALEGTSMRDGTVISDWTIDATAVQISRFRLSGSLTITSNGGWSEISHTWGFSAAKITVNADRVLLSHIHYTMTVEFGSNTVEGEIGIKSGAVTVTDNGNNSILGGS